MTLLDLVLLFKILVTIAFVIGPLSIQSGERTMARYGVLGGSYLIFNLYIAAILALLVNYGLGLVQSFDGQFPTAAVWVGIVSNCGAAGVLAYEKYCSANKGAAIADIASILVFAVIGLLFCASLIWENVFFSPVW